MKRHSTLGIGCYSDGTMTLEDLLPALRGELAALRLTKAERQTVRTIAHTSNQDGYYETEDASWDYEELKRIANVHMPSWTYWGGHPGDEVCFGVWVSDEIEHDFDGLKVGDLAEVPVGYTGEVLVVNDHGNMSLYSYARGRKSVIWEVV